MRRARTLTGRVLEAAGFLAIACGCGLAWLPLGLVVGGALLVFLAQGVGE